VLRQGFAERCFVPALLKDNVLAEIPGFFPGNSRFKIPGNFSPETVEEKYNSATDKY
jgi:hypothetical protein